MPEPSCDARLVYRPEYDAYDFGSEHPLDQQLQPPPASLEELRLIHSASYLDAVQSLDLFADDPLLADEGTRWGHETGRQRKKDVGIGRVGTATLILVALGILGTFPTFFDVFVG